MNKKTYTNLHCHSVYSSLDGLSKVSDIVDRAIELNSPAVCITDHAFATSHYELSELCLKKNIKPIFGVEGYLSPKSNTTKEKIEGYKDYYHITMLAQNEVGYKNLMKIISDSFINGFYKKARTSLEVLERYNEGIIVLTACLGSYVSQMFLADRDDEAYSWAKIMREIFGKERFFIELTWTGLEQQDQVNIKLIKLAEDLDLDIIATCDSHYSKIEDSETHRAMVCININRPFTPTGKEKEGEDVDQGSMFYTPNQYYIKDRETLVNQYYNKFPDHNKYFDNTNKIANSCDWIKFDKSKKFPSKYEDPNSELMNRIINSLNEKISLGILNIKDKDSYIKRIKEELTTITKMDFSDYFIEMQDIIKWANDNGISTGPGRGCFTEDTPVRLWNGESKKIKDIIIGDILRNSKNDSSIVIGNLKYPVFAGDHLISVKYKSFDYKNSTYSLFNFLCTPDHKILVLDLVNLSEYPFKNFKKEYYIKAKDLTPGVHVLVCDGGYGKHSYSLLQGVSKVVLNNDIYVYDLMVSSEEDRSFIIGSNYVHNSGAGSFINFLLNITRVNPLTYDLIFERMLSEGRCAIPQIEDILN